jgi:hypothetical protein
MYYVRQWAPTEPDGWVGGGGGGGRLCHPKEGRGYKQKKGCGSSLIDGGGGGRGGGVTNARAPRGETPWH